MQVILVIAAAFINFTLSAIWYGIFDKQWLSAWDLDDSKVKKMDPKPYLISLIGSLWASYGLFLIIKHIQPKNIEELLTIAVGTWLFILVGLGAKHYSFARVKGKAFVFGYGLDLVGIIAMSFIIAEI
jgi:hypothetical protein